MNPNTNKSGVFPNGRFVSIVTVICLIATVFAAFNTNDAPAQQDIVLGEKTFDVSNPESGVRSDPGEPDPQGGSLTIAIGADNDQNDGQGMGRIYKSSSYYYSYDYPYMYHYMSGTSYESRPWSVFDLSDLSQYKGVTITEGKIHYWKYTRNYVTEIEVWTMNSIPYDISGSSSTAQGWYNEIGGTGSVLMATATYTGSYDSTREDMWIDITPAGIAELNTRLTVGMYDFAMGDKITDLYSGTYGYMYWGDIRLDLEFTYTAMPDDEEGEIAVANEGVAYGTSSTKYDYYNYAYLSSSYRSYASFDATMVNSLLPKSAPGSTVTITGVYLRMNTDYYSSAVPTVRPMVNDPMTASWSTIYADAGAGTPYYTHTDYVTYPAELEFDLGADAVVDFKDTMDGSPDFFAVGFTSVSSGRLLSIKLVIKWEIEGPPETANTIVLGSDNPEHDGEAMGYSYNSGSSYYVYSYYYGYAYKSSYERRIWATFDLADLNEWSGVQVTEARLLLQQDYRYYAKDIRVTALSTTPYNSPGSAKSKAIFDESGPSGVEIGQYMAFSETDTSNHLIEIDLNSAAVTRLNSILAGSPTYYTFGVGIYIKELHEGRTYGYMRWNDARLEVKFEFTDELKVTQSGHGIAFGDELSGYIYRGTTNYNIGYMYLRTYSTYAYRSYATWDVEMISDQFPGDAAIIIKKVGLRFNHRYSSLSDVYVYQMSKDVMASSAFDIYNDAADGTLYSGPNSMSSSFNEYDWDLGPDAVNDFQYALTNKIDHFAVGIITTDLSTYAYDYGPKLVIEWESIVMIPPVADAGPDNSTYEGQPIIFDGSGSIGSRPESGGAPNPIVKYEWDFESDGVYDYVESLKPPEDKTVVLGSDNPTSDGYAIGYSYLSSSGYYYLYSYYYSYAYWTSSYERRGFTVFDISDLRQWSGVKVTKAEVLVQNYYRYYAKDVRFTSLDTIPYNGAGTSVIQAIYDESGPSGTEIGQYVETSTYDTSRHLIEIELDAAAVTELNNALAGTSDAFGLGFYVKEIFSGYSYGYVRWCDIRLRVTIDYTNELLSTSGVALGDELTGRLYMSSSGSASNYQDGYMYLRTYSTYAYRGYAQWDTEEIARTLPPNPKINSVRLQFNHQYSTLSDVYVYQMDNDVWITAADTLFQDAGDGTQYSGPNSLSSSYSEYDWDLGSGAVNDLQYALNTNRGYFGVGIMTTSTSGYGYDYGPRLVIGWTSSGGGTGLTGRAETTIGDDGVYMITLRVTDSLGLTDTDTCNVTVKNLNPTIDPFGPYTVNEGSPLTLAATSTDPGSDDLSFRWSFELGPTMNHVHYNDGVGPDPYPSPRGRYPFIVTDTAVQTYGDNGVYKVSLTVTDDDGGSASASTTITVTNVAPIIAPFGPLSVEEGSLLSISAIVTDPGSDDMFFEWTIELGPSPTAMYYNDGMGPDPAQSPWGTWPFVVTDVATHTYGDDGVYDIRLKVTDDDGASTIYTTTVTVTNVNPDLEMEAYMLNDFTLRISGEKWHDVQMTIFEDGAILGTATLMRSPGDPDEQSITLWDVKCDVTKRISVLLLFTPYDDVLNGQISGSDKAWVIVTFEDGDKVTFYHEFNYQKPGGWARLFQLNRHFVGHEITFKGTATDPGSDDLTFTWVWGDGSPSEGATYYNDGVGPDPAKSPFGTYPFSVTEIRGHTYWMSANYDVTMTVVDDDGGSSNMTITVLLT